jgi:hypothetical protein
MRRICNWPFAICNWGRRASVPRCLGAFLLLCLSAAPVGQTAPAATGPSFRTLQVYLDPGGTPLAAYQVEIVGDFTLVGVEAGPGQGRMGFSDPPYYDPAALAGGRVIVGGYSLADELPAGRTCVATLHVRIATANPGYQVKLLAAGARDGSRLECPVTISEISEGDHP